MNQDFRKSEEWKLEGKDFLIVVRHYTSYVMSGYESEDGGNRWNVYAYIYPKHKHFSKFSGPHMWQHAASMMPLHGGPSFLHWHYDDEHKPTSVQVGCDYNHLHDDAFTFYANQESADEVFGDARALHAWLESEGGAT